jgi:hypothetical protein
MAEPSLQEREHDVQSIEGQVGCLFIGHLHNIKKDLRLRMIKWYLA